MRRLNAIAAEVWRHLNSADISFACTTMLPSETKEWATIETKGQSKKMPDQLCDMLTAAPIRESFGGVPYLLPVQDCYACVTRRRAAQPLIGSD